MNLGTLATRARRTDDAWHIETPTRTYRSRHLICASGAHNRPRVPNVNRTNVELHESHSCGLRDPRTLTGRDIAVVGGGASAYDPVDLCFEHEARSVNWVFRQTRWMLPTRKPKSQTGGPRVLAATQFSGSTSEPIRQASHADMTARYAKLGLLDIMPSEPFDLGRHQLISGRWRMIANDPRIKRHRSEVTRISGRNIALENAQTFDADILLWATGYEIDLSLFENPTLSGIRRHEDLVARCGCGTFAMAEGAVYFMATALESTGTAPWAYARMARTVMSHIQGRAMLEPVPFARKINHFDDPAFLAPRDPSNFPVGRWEDECRRLATGHPADLPLPIPDWRRSSGAPA
jgi:cation diffusion facilitator CzcD-associated flavoprotein CzcO